MKIFLFVLFLFSAICFSQAKNELEISLGFHKLEKANFQRASYGILAAEESGAKNGIQETNFYSKLAYYRVLNEFLKIGTGVEFNSVSGYTNISPFLSTKVIYLDNSLVHPYCLLSLGLNFMKYEQTPYYPGIFYEVGSGLNVRLSKMVYMDLGLSYTYLDSREKHRVQKIVTNSVKQKFNLINFAIGISYRIP